MNRLPFPHALFTGALFAASIPVHSLAAQVRWQQDAVPPPVVPRSDAGVVWMASADRLVLTGGWNGSRDLDETWTFDGATWTRQQPTNSPGEHSSHGLAYDAARDRVVLFGGWNAGGLRSAETWEWDGADWQQRQPSRSPSARASVAMAYDPRRGRVVLFGGTCGAGCAFGDTWEWDGQDWSQVPTGSAAPAARYSAAFAWDAVGGRLVLFGGRTPGARVDDTWAYDANGWQRLQPSRAPSPRSAAACATDPARGRIVLFGGFDGAWRDDTWEFDGAEWIPRSPVGAMPSGRGFAAMAHHPGLRRSVLVGGAAGAAFPRDAWGYEPVDAGGLRPFGTGCPAAAPSLTTAGGALPWLGDTLRFEFRAAVGTARRPLLWLGASRTVWRGSPLPLDLGAYGLPGCDLLVAPDVGLPMTPIPTGIADVAVTVPRDPALIGSRVFAQAIDVSGSAVPFTLTGGLELVLGSR